MDVTDILGEGIEQPITIDTNSGAVITATSHYINCSDGKTYTIIGNTLKGSDGSISYNISSYEEAIGIVIGFCGGKKR